MTRIYDFVDFINFEILIPLPQAVFDRESCPNYIQSQSRVLSDAVLNFQLNQDEVTLCVSPEKIIIRNYVEDEPGIHCCDVLPYIV